MEYIDLVNKAIEAKKMAYAPYSKYKVGAALLTKKGSVYLGCNIENVSYGATNCAERTAIFKAVSDGVLEFEAIAVVGGIEDRIEFSPPCGICRQVMDEFCDKDFKIILYDGKDIKVFTLDEILPLGSINL